MESGPLLSVEVGKSIDSTNTTIEKRLDTWYVKILIWKIRTSQKWRLYRR